MVPFSTHTFTGKEMVDYIADYLSNIRSRRTFPNVEPGYMRNLIPDSAPQTGESWDEIARDIERVIMPGVSESLCKVEPMGNVLLSNVTSCL